MIYKVIAKDEFRKLVDGLCRENLTFGPRKVEEDRHGKPIYRFETCASFADMDLDYTKAQQSLKHFFLPNRETLSRFTFKGDDWEQEVEYRVFPKVLVGVRACDISALCILDQIFIHGSFPSAYYQARRQNTFVIGMDHEPLDDCFCESLGHHVVSHGFNLFCTDLGDSYYLAVNSSKAFRMLKNVKTADPTKADDSRYIERRKSLERNFKTRVELSDLSSLMDIEFQSPIWDRWSAKCLSCGSCAMVCPTCYCYGIEENIDINLKSASKERLQYSCNLVDFAEVAGGHNFRPGCADRLKYRYYHHYRGFAENDSEKICVGCNRCGATCLAGINPAEVIKDLRQESGSEL